MYGGVCVRGGGGGGGGEGLCECAVCATVMRLKNDLH